MINELLLQRELESAPIQMSGEDLCQAKEHLYGSLKIVEEKIEAVSCGIYNALFAAADLADGWFELNKCRLYTEQIIQFEECLQPAMGLICDAKCMIEHMAAKNMGLTHYGKLSILQALQQAISLIRAVIEELESWGLPEHDDYEIELINQLFGDNKKE